MAKDNKAANAYAKPHGDLMQGSEYEPKMPTRKNWTPLNGGVSIGINDEVESAGIKIRGTGAATKGTMARGPMA